MKTTRRRRRASARPLDAWEAAWQRHWRTAGLPDYELPPNAADPDRRLLTGSRSARSEAARLRRVERELAGAFARLLPLGPAVTVFGSARFRPDHRYYRLARAVGAELARAGLATITGGGPGIMEAANRGAHEAGGVSCGLNIRLPHEQGANPYVDLSHEFGYFFTRKVCLVKYACAFIVLPGGLGTLDELFEAATLVQCRKIGPFPIVLMGRRFWGGLRRWGDAMMAEGVFTRDEIGFGRITDSPRDAVDLIVRSLPPPVRARLRPAAPASSAS
jgi:uncharacterized protein (TIGR00730 family)